MLLRVAVGLLLWAILPVQACGPLRLAYRAQPGVYERWPDGTLRGSDVEAIAELARRSGCRIVGQEFSNAAAWKGLEEGYVDLIPSALVLPERERIADMVPLLTGRIVLLVHREQARRTPDLAAFEADPQARVLVQRASAYPPQISQWLQSPAMRDRVDVAGDLPALLRAFEAGRGVAIPMYPLLLRHGSLRRLEHHAVWDPWPRDALPGGLAMSRRSVSESDRARLRQALYAMVRDGTLQRIVERHFEPTMVRQQLRFHVGP